MASQRDLTSNNPHFHISSSRNNTNDDFNSDHNPRNPFGDEPEEEERIRFSIIFILITK